MRTVTHNCDWSPLQWQDPATGQWYLDERLAWQAVVSRLIVAAGKIPATPQQFTAMYPDSLHLSRWGTRTLTATLADIDDALNALGYFDPTWDER
jgi:hypothetical protein